jgi:hypothetical protein
MAAVFTGEIAFGVLQKNSAGMEELPDDDTHVSKHVGGAE